MSSKESKFNKISALFFFFFFVNAGIMYMIPIQPQHNSEQGDGQSQQTQNNVCKIYLIALSCITHNTVLVS